MALQRHCHGQIDADHPVRNAAHPSGQLDVSDLVARFQVRERVQNPLFGLRSKAHALHGLCAAAKLIDIGKDDLAFAVEVGRVDNAIALLKQLFDQRKLLFRARVKARTVGSQLQFVRVRDKRRGQPPPVLVGEVVVRGVLELHQMSEAPRHKAVVAVEANLQKAVVRLLRLHRAFVRFQRGKVHRLTGTQRDSIERGGDLVADVRLFRKNGNHTFSQGMRLYCFAPKTLAYGGIFSAVSASSNLD